MSDLQNQIAGLTPAELALLEARLRSLRASAQREATIAATANRESAPLSSTQQRIWFLEQLNPGLATYNRLVVYRLKCFLNLKALDDSLTEIISRHEILRTAFSTVNGRPLQVVFPAKPFVSRFCDLSTVAPVSKESLVQQLASEEGRAPFDLSAGLLLRAKVLRLSEAEHLLLLTFHHIAIDGWSIGIFLDELSRCYEAFASGVKPELAPLPLQYADYAVWQRERLAGPLLEQQLQYWREQLAGAPQELCLPTDHARPAVQSYRGATTQFELDRELVQELKEWSRAQGVTLFMSLLAVFQVLLWRYSGERELVVGTPIANRSRVELEGLIGCFANTLVLRTRLEEGASFAELVKRVREVCLGAYAHQEVPFERLVEELQPERKLSHSPLFQVMFVLQNAPAQHLEIPSLKFEPVSIGNGSAKFDLTLILEENQESLSCCFEYSTDLFEAATITRMIGYLRNVLKQVLNNPNQPLWQVPVLTQAEQRQLLVEWNQTHTDYPRQQCIHKLFEAQVEKTPNDVAVVFGEQQLTYKQLNEKANQLANYLLSLGVTTGSLVGICSERSCEMVIGILAILKAGGAYVPLDPGYPPERLSYMLNDTGAPVLILQRRFQDRFAEHDVKLIFLDDDQETIAQQSAHNPVCGATPDSLAYIMYTSGSTGVPKGACVNHRAVVRLVREQNYIELGRDDVILQFAPVSFDASTLELWGSLLNGGRLVLMSPGMTSLEDLGRAIRDYGITTLWLTAGLFHLMVDYRLEDLKSVRQLLAGGDVLSVSHVRKFLEAAPESKLINGYGPTENTTFTCCHRMSDASSINSTVPIGRPIANTQVYLLDAHLQPVPLGGIGNLYIGGDGLAQGYLNQPVLTAEKFIPHPFAEQPGARLYDSGDLARYWQNGIIEFLGRADRQIKVRGFRVELGEIQEILVQHPAVKAAIVVVLDEARNKRIVAYVVGDRQVTDTGALRSYMQQRVPAYMIPSAFVPMDQLPLTPNGKVDLAALPAPDISKSEMAGNSLEVTGGIEEILAGIWADVLGTETVGLFDDFFDLGGHSLLATQVLSRIREVFGIELALSALFAKPTVATLAKEVAMVLRGEEVVEDTPVQPTNRDVPQPLSFAQQRIWFMEKLKPGSGLYNVPIAYRVQGKLNLAALEQSINTIIKRHDTLRTRFQTVDGELKQVVANDVALKVEVAEPTESEMQRLASEEGRAAFDLTAGLLLRAKVLRLSEAEHLLLLTFHHIAIDGWSIGIFLDELSRCYEAFASGAKPELAPLPLQYADYAV